MMFKIKALMMMMFQWHAGNVACKVLMMIRTGGYILSSLMLIVLSVDRLISNTTNHHQKYNTSLRLILIITNINCNLNIEKKGSGLSVVKWLKGKEH